MLTRLGLGKKPEPVDESAAEIAETQRLLEAGQISQTEASIQTFLATEGADVLDTSALTIPESVKPFMLFQTYGFVGESVTFCIAIIICISMFVSGCWIAAGSMAAICASLGYLAIPQMTLPFISNPLMRWFVVSNHSTHMTSLVAILGVFVYVAYFSWFNTCPTKKLSALFLITICSAIALLMVACARNEKGNGGYIRWIFKWLF